MTGSDDIAEASKVLVSVIKDLRKSGDIDKYYTPDSGGLGGSYLRPIWEMLNEVARLRKESDVQ